MLRLGGGASRRVVWLPAGTAAQLGLEDYASGIVDCEDSRILLLDDHAASAIIDRIAPGLVFGQCSVSTGADELGVLRAAVQARKDGMARAAEIVEPAAAERMVTAFLDDPKVGYVFQPIVSIATGATVAHEILARPRDVNIGELVTAAAASGRGVELDLVLLAGALDRLECAPRLSDIHVNVLPATLLDPRFDVRWFVRSCRTRSIEPHRLTIECTEYQVIDDLDSLSQRVAALRLAGFGFGVDDAGAGHASFALVARARPTTIKIDRSIVSGCDTDSAKQGLIQAFLLISRRIGARLVAEGIETDQELEELRALGVDLGQGFLLGRPEPSPVFTNLAPKVVAADDALATETSGSVLPRVASIAAPAPVVQASITGQEARELFLDDTSLTTLVFSDMLGRPKAALTRERLFRSFSGQYGYAIFANRPAMELADPAPPIVRADESIENVAMSATARLYDSLYDDLLVVNPSGRVVGLVRVRDLLRALANVDLEEARDLNPLTGLPGNRRIEQALGELLARDEALAVSYVDLNHFKAFNDAAGWVAGDRAIAALGRAIVDVTGRRGVRFVGHIGGDDFVVAWAGDLEAEQGAAEIARLASETMAGGDEIPSYTELPGITVATLLLKQGEIRDVATLANRLAVLKGVAKRRNCSVHAMAVPAAASTPRWLSLEEAVTSGTSIALGSRRGSLLA